jgi:hypothetical protein
MPARAKAKVLGENRTLETDVQESTNENEGPDVRFHKDCFIRTRQIASRSERLTFRPGP